MKEATGELNMTVVAIAAVAAFFYAFVWPSIKTSISMNTCNNVCPGGKATSYDPDANKCKCDDGTEIEITEE